MTTLPAGVRAGTVRARALAAADALPRTFPLGTFVAANPLHGLEHLPFEQAATAAAATMGASSYLSEQEYRDLFAAGRIREHGLRRAVVQHWPDGDRMAAYITVALSPGSGPEGVTAADLGVAPASATARTVRILSSDCRLTAPPVNRASERSASLRASSTRCPAAIAGSASSAIESAPLQRRSCIGGSGGQGRQAPRRRTTHR